jgi:hypothetical protein
MTDSPSVSDFITSVISSVRTYSDSASISDTLSAQFLLSRSLIEDTNFEDAITIRTFAARTPLEFGIVDDTISTQFLTARTTADFPSVNDFITFSVGTTFSKIVSDSILMTDSNSDKTIEGAIQLPPSPPLSTSQTSTSKKGGSGSTGVGPSSPASSTTSPPSTSPSSVSSAGSESKVQQDEISKDPLVRIEQTPDVEPDITMDPEPVSPNQFNSDSTKTEKPGFNILDNPQTVLEIAVVVSITTLVSIFIAILRKGLI